MKNGRLRVKGIITACVAFATLSLLLMATAAEVSLAAIHRAEVDSAGADLASLDGALKVAGKKQSEFIAAYDRRRERVQARLVVADRQRQRALAVLAIFALVSVGTTLLVGRVLARRVARPLRELVLRAEASGATRSSQRDEIGALSEHMNALVERIAKSSTALAENRARLAQAEKMSALGEMAAAVAHEVINPLTGVKAAMQLLARTSDSAEVRDTAAAVDLEIGRVEALARRLMCFSRPISVDKRVVPLQQAFDRLIAAVVDEATSHGVVIELDASQVREVFADGELLDRVLHNLVLNACQAMGQGGRIRIISRAVDARWHVIDVADDGPGISESLTGRLFTPFATTRPNGNGLGLAISQNMILAHGGRLSARGNAPQRGTTFSIWLPLEDA